MTTRQMAQLGQKRAVSPPPATFSLQVRSTSRRLLPHAPLGRPARARVFSSGGEDHALPSITTSIRRPLDPDASRISLEITIGPFPRSLTDLVRSCHLHRGDCIDTLHRRLVEDCAIESRHAGRPNGYASERPPALNGAWLRSQAARAGPMPVSAILSAILEERIRGRHEDHHARDLLSGRAPGATPCACRTRPSPR